MLAKVERAPGARQDLTSLPAVTRYEKVLKENDLVGKTAHVWQQLAKIPEKNSRGFSYV